jgi:hypothetical protein
LTGAAAYRAAVDSYSALTTSFALALRHSLRRRTLECPRLSRLSSPGCTSEWRRGCTPILSLSQEAELRMLITMSRHRASYYITSQRSIDLPAAILASICFPSYLSSSFRTAGVELSVIITILQEVANGLLWVPYFRHFGTLTGFSLSNS